MAIEHDYFYGGEAEQFAFYRIPRQLFTDDRYRFISTEAKILYGLILDRMDLSIKNGWYDKNGRVYIYFTLDSIQEKTGHCRAKVTKMLNELDKKTGLIERVRQGQGKPTRIYVKKFTAQVGKTDFLKSKKQTSRLPKNRSQEVGKIDSNHTEINKTEYNHTEYQSIYPEKPAEMDMMDKINAYRDLVLENLEYDILVQQYGRERMDEIVDIIMDTISTKRPHIRIGGDEYPLEVVKSRLLKLDSSHIAYVFDCVDKNTTKVYNIRAYLLTALYNAPSTIDHYYTTLVNHDLYGQGGAD